MKAFHNGKAETDEEFVKRALQGEAWAEFVERYADAVFGRARKWTWLAVRYRREKKLRVIIRRKKQEYSESTLDAFIWIFEHLKLKLRYYGQRTAKSLDEFIAEMLKMPNLRNDYLDWCESYLPNPLKKASKEEKQIFLDLLSKMTAGEIAQARTKEEAYKIDPQTGKPIPVKEKESFSVEQVLHTEDQIHEKLKRSGQGQEISGAMEIPLEEMEERIAAPGETSTDEHLQLAMIKERFIAALRQLEWSEILLLRLFYNENFSAEEILEAFKQADLSLPTIMKPIQAAMADEVYKALERVRARLLKLFQRECQDLPEATITSKIILMLLKLLGVAHEYEEKA